MLTATEASNCRNMLQYLPSADIQSLCETVCNRLIVPTCLEEAVDAIIQYSKSAQELIGRKKVKADVLFKYLQSAGVNISPKASKTELVSKTLDLWRESPNADTTNPAQRGSTGTPIQVIHTEINNFTVIQNQEDNGQKLAFDFANWFYPLLRSLHETKEKWGPQHFWPGSKLQFCVMTSTDNVHYELCEGPEAASEKIASLVLKESVVFNPSTTVEGCRGVLSPHGLGKVAVQGTMHKYANGRSGDVVGVFEQMFGLIRDLNDGNNFKIKHCELRITVASDQRQYNGQPSLTQDAVMFLKN